MKILIILRKLKGGVGRANTEIANALRKKGHKVDILSREDDLKIYSLAKSIFPLRRKIRKLMKEKNYDIIYTQDYSMAIPLLFPRPIFWKKHFCCFCGTKKWIQPDAFTGHHRIIQKIVGVMMGRKLVSIGDGIHKRFPKSTKIYRGVDFKKFRPLGKKRDRVGWIKRDTELISKKELRKISKSTGLKLTIAENIPPHKMNNFYNKCKVFISLPRNDGYNNSWNEAIAAGTPIIIGNEEGAGSFLPIHTIPYKKNKVGGIVDIINNTKGKSNRKWLINNNFSWEDKTDELIKFFRNNLRK
ncbi:MAG: glycosyltransferase [Candidatus Pacearchaeota archaeon]